MSNKISHSGIIKSISDDCIKVQIVQASACAACKVSSHCNASELKVKIVDVFADGRKYKEGQPVVVSASDDVAKRALLLGFGIPFLILISVLFIALKLFTNEGIAAIAAIGALAPYYFALWMMRDRIQQQISFKLED